MSNETNNSQNEFDMDTSVRNELDLIDNLGLDEIKDYLNEPDSSKIASDFVHMDGPDKKLDARKKSTRKKRYKFTHLSRSQRLRIQNRRLNKQPTDVAEHSSAQVNESNENSNDESNESNDEADELDQDLTTNQYLIQGKQIELNRSDYNKYIVHGKWRPAEFFRLKQLDTSTKCEFCSFKSKTHIENHSICYHCRNFAHVSLIKHHMFVCKDNNRGPNQRCKFKRLNNTTLQAQDPDKIYCRFCHFSLILDTLPSLNRLQKYLVQFVNNRVIYVNSSSKKTMLWKTRLDLNKNEPSSVRPPAPVVPKIAEKPLRKPVEPPKTLVDKENKPADVLNESVDLNYDDRPLKGPRVKHVSRSRPLYLQPLDHNQKKANRIKFYDELKTINQDKEHVFITWQSFTSDLKNQFTLSALPEKFKASLYTTYEFKFLEASKTKNLNEVLISSEQSGRKNDASVEKGEERPFRAKIRKTGPRVEGQSSVLKTVFDWDDYFERNHRISSNQNFRLSCLNQNGKDTYVPKSMSLIKATSQFDYDSTSSKRFSCKLNSYKDRFQFNLDSLNDKLKESINQLNTDFASNDKNNNTTLSSNKNILINSNDFFQTSSLNNGNGNSSNTGTIPFPFVIPDYLVWDNNIINKYRDIPGTGFSVISYSPYSIKSLCFLCGSTPENDNKFYYCTICCQPYHEFCLEDYQKPKANTILLDWLCPCCKYCEICHLITDDLQFCYKCGDSYHFDCLKKSSYPRRLTKKRKQWLCFKCFECKICFTKNSFYDKKSYSRMNNYDYSTCFKCYEKYQLEKPFKCCNLMFNDCIQDNEKLDIYKFIYQCRTCLNYFHYHCLGLSKIDIDLLLMNGLRPECKSCDSEPNSLKQQISLFKANIFNDIVSSVQDNPACAFTDDLVESINDFFIQSKTGIENSDDQLRLKLIQKIETRHNWLLDYMNDNELGIKPKEKESAEPETEKMEVIEQNEPVEIRVKSEQEIQKEQMLLEETKKNFIFSDLVKVPHEDHTYSIASNSIALALQASDIFDENLTLEKLNSFLERIKECQMNPTLQKIFNAHFAPINALNANSGSTAAPLKPFNSRKLDRFDKISESKMDFNNLDTIRIFSNVKHNAVDCRECMACRLIGDDDICGRLIPFDCYWIHLNCLLWSDDVLIDDCIIEQILSVFNKTKTICSYCKRDGATITCDYKSCSLSYHFNCAFESKCLICEDLSQSQPDKRSKFQGFCIYCPEHASHQTEDDFLKESKFKKSIFIDVHDDNYRRKYSFPKFSLNPPKQKPYILIGSLQIDNLGDLETLSDHKDYLCPVDFECSRLFWSTNELGKKCIYKCRIRLLNDYKKDLEKKSQSSEENSLNTSDLRFYLDNFCEEKEQNLNQKLNEDIGLLSQVDGLNDLNLNPNKSVLKFSNANGGVSFIRPPQTTIRLPGLSNPATNQNTEKPKVLKLEANNLKFSNLKTTYVRVPNQQTLTSDIFKNPILNINQPRNDAVLSPRSDRSDSSLNLNNSSYLVNPLQSSLDDMGHESTLNATDITVNENFKIFDRKEKVPKVKKDKIGKEKKPRKIKAESLSTKCTVAALLNAFNKVEKPSELAFSNSDVSNDHVSSTSNSSQLCGYAPTDSQLSIRIPNDSLNNFDFFVKKKEKKMATTPKVKNKLRDYFKDDFDFKISFTNSLASGSQLNVIPQNVQPIGADSGSNFENPIKSMDFVEAKRMDKQIRKKEAKLMKAKVKIISLNEKKRMKIAKKMSIQSSLMDDQLFEQYAMSNAANSYNRCIVNNYYNDLDLESSNNKLVFEITCEDGLKVISHDLNRAWKVIFDKIRKLRQEHKLKNIAFKNLNGVRMCGLDSPAVIYMLEQLESIQFCPLYKTKYIHSQNTNDRWIINLNNCARTQKHDGAKKCLDPFYWLASEHRSLNFLNLSQRFDQKFFQAAKALQSLDICGSTKYRHLKDFSKSALVVKRSPIHGRGLFTLVDLSQGQMIIEYSGEIIRNEVCDKREKFYESKGIGCYMFRIDEFEVIDATTKGNQARFINHSCDPNCISRVLVIGGHKHIVIFAQRAISRGEELTYDYKFPKEDVKIKCLCKSSRCRKYLN
ncbi:histone-lysine N-methyltransferase 2B [Brachionus plicatilis]|uniref:Histone-lysine N-methyltransferase 2B n=1 Tax=Brachionus plicatilis TaxID=10195 RepID=A0A3M7PXR0_BRAPC|nr:histone-lysine N-methyltransferase 2B [Brachionus plicatilis]